MPQQIEKCFLCKRRHKKHCKMRLRYEKSLAELDKRLRPLIEANRAAERITGEDLNIIVY